MGSNSCSFLYKRSPSKGQKELAAFIGSSIQDTKVVKLVVDFEKLRNKIKKLEGTTYT